MVFRASGSCGSAREAPAGMLEGSGWPEGRRQRAIAQKSGNSPAAVRCDSGTIAARTGAIELGVNPGLRADLWWGSAGAVARQGVVAVAAPACGAAEQGAEEQSGVGVAARVGGSMGVRGRYLKGGGAPWACAPGFGKPASVSAEIAGFSCARGKTGLTVGPGCQWSRATRGENGRAERSAELGCGCGPRASGRVGLGVSGPVGEWLGRGSGLR